MSSYLIAAAVLSFLVLGIHVFLGGPSVARPLLAAKDIEPVAKYTAYLCWHLITMVLVAMTAGFAHAAASPRGADVAVLMSVLAGGFAGWSGVLVVWKRQRAWDLPQWLFFLPISALGLLGVWR
jgi:hypothetical protein